MRRPFPAALLVPACVLLLAGEEPKAGPKGVAQDEAIEALARKALGSDDAAFQKETLESLKNHRFRSSRAPQREFVLFATGILEDRLGNSAKAVEPLKRLESLWPKSVYLPEAQTILGLGAVERRRFKEAESRLRAALYADIPVEAKRRAQELLLWTFAEQDQLDKGLPILESLYPIGTAQPSERGLVAMTEILAAAKRKDEAEAVRKDYHALYPKGTLGPRVDLACGRMLGALGDAQGSADLLQKVIQEAPNQPQADEARLALASLLSEGRLTSKQAKAFPSPDSLLAEIRKAEKQGDVGRRALLIKLRMQVNASRWKEAVDLTAQIRALSPTEEEASTVTRLRADAFRAWAQEQLDKHDIDPLLAYLDGEGIRSLGPEQRSLLARRLAQVGLGAAALRLAEAAPAAERSGLKRGILADLQADAQPTDALMALPPKGESGPEALKRAQAALSLKDYKTVKAALVRAPAGPGRIGVLLAYLRRPQEDRETPQERLREAEAWLARSTERGADREPLTLLVADLRAKAGDWKGALELYPVQPAKDQRGWVALMRATCQLKLGRRDAARSTLQQAVDEPGFRMERESLGRQLGVGGLIP